MGEIAKLLSAYVDTSDGQSAKGDKKKRSQIEFSRDMGIDATLVSKWLNGTKNLTWTHIPRLVMTLGIDHETVLDAVKRDDENRKPGKEDFPQYEKFTCDYKRFLEERQRSQPVISLRIHSMAERLSRLNTDQLRTVDAVIDSFSKPADREGAG